MLRRAIDGLRAMDAQRDECAASCNATENVMRRFTGVQQQHARPARVPHCVTHDSYHGKRDAHHQTHLVCPPTRMHGRFETHNALGLVPSPVCVA